MNEGRKNIAQLQKLITKDSLSINNKKSWLTLVRAVALVLTFSILIFYVDIILLKMIISILAGFSIVGLFVLGHDCGHYAFHKTRWVNDAVGVIVFTPLLNSLFAWRRFHNFLHQNTQVKGVDPDWPELLLTNEELKSAKWHQKIALYAGLRTPLGLLIGFWVGMTKRLFYPFLIPVAKMKTKDRNVLIIQNILTALASFLFVYLLAVILTGKELFWIYILPALIAAVIGAFLTWIQHTQENSYVFDKNNYDIFHAQVMSSYNVHFPKIFEWMWLDINIHIPHHLSTKMPWYHLKECFNLIRKHDPSMVKEKSFKFTMIPENLKLISLNKDENNSFWKLGKS